MKELRLKPRVERAESMTANLSPNYYAAKKRVNGRVNALSLKPLYQQLAYKGADPEAERDYYCRSDEFGQRVNELRYKCFKVKCRKFFSHSFFLRFEYDLL